MQAIWQLHLLNSTQSPLSRAAKTHPKVAAGMPFHGSLTCLCIYTLDFLLFFHVCVSVHSQTVGGPAMWWLGPPLLHTAQCLQCWHPPHFVPVAVCRQICGPTWFVGQQLLQQLPAHAYGALPSWIYCDVCEHMWSLRAALLVTTP